ncbi:hypothetical protein AVL61_15900 [Kocuria rosea subsp. polaris]|uniref:Uncharacterized protein n=1 Tax=Kocuria rosea subsp. polaris TaxID=136273 RepID=A0A0W8I1Y3_KOCRO|nr:hypothetical protein [Kocuria polaris]KUG51722.1 hypothetical protein AVL61_15900 [Kocuria polaris]
MKRKLPALGVMVIVTVVVAWIAYLILDRVPWGGISGGVGVWLALIFWQIAINQTGSKTAATKV